MPTLALIADILIVVTFGMSISLLIKAKKTNELIVDNKESTIEQPKQ